MTRDELFEKYFREQLTVGELDELKRLLRDSDDARRDFARFTEERSILVRLTGRLAGQESRELPGLPGPVFRPALQRPTVLPAKRQASPYWIVAAVSAAAILLLTMALLVVPTKNAPREEISKREPKRVDPVPAPPKPEPPAPKPGEPKKPELPAPKPEEPKKTEEPAPKPEPPAPKPEEPKKPDPPKRDTVAETTIATLEKSDGTVVRIAGTAKIAIKAGEGLFAGQGVETVGGKSAATFAYPDGTRVRLEGETIVLHLQSDGGKRFTVDTGAVAADVAKQPDGQPLTIFSPHGQAAILGTSLRVSVFPALTHVEVKQGRVQVTRKSDAKSVVVTDNQSLDLFDGERGNNDQWTKYSRKVETGTFTHITVAIKTGTRSPSGPTAGIDGLRVVPGSAEDFEAMPRWDSTFEAPWGGPATWTLEPGGQAGRFLQVARPGPGSSVRVRVIAVPSRATVDVSAFLKCPAGSPADFWIEFGYRLGSFTAQDFDQNASSWTLIKKFDSAGGGDLDVRTSPARK